MCRFEQRITCRAMFTDEKNHYDLKKNSANNQYLASIYGFWNQGQKVSFRYKFQCIIWTIKLLCIYVEDNALFNFL